MFRFCFLCASAPLRELLAVCIAAVCCAGCGQRNPLGTVPVGGKVTYNGQPVESATVAFNPDGDGRPATAITAPDGSYSLTTLNWPGAVPGQYTVVVRKSNVALASTQPVTMEEALKLNNRPPPPPKELLPAKYSDAAKSPLKVEVKKASKNAIDLPLAD
jgi:hypothetical protein